MGTQECPLCEKGCKHRGHLRTHIHRHHRKSELITAYLALLDAPSETVIQQSQEWDYDETSERPVDD